MPSNPGPPVTPARFSAPWTRTWSVSPASVARKSRVARDTPPFFWITAILTACPPMSMPIAWLAMR
jgi:hypothetical protein